MRGRIVEHTLDPWISKLVEAILAKEGSGERYWLGLSIHGSFETNQNSGLLHGDMCDPFREIENEHGTQAHVADH